jgi:DNA-binding beta-propeller fold protein YncE
VIADIPNTPGVHGIAIASALGKGFTSNGRDSTVTVFDLKTSAPVASIKVTGRNPDAIMYEPVSGRVFTFNGGSANATAIDAKTNTVVGTVDIGGKPEFARSDAAGRVYVNNEDKSEIVVFDASTLKVLARWPLAPCEEPSGLAMDRAGKRLFSGCSNKMMAVVDMANGKVVTTLPIGDGADAAAFDPGTGLAFASGGDGTITVIRATARDRYVVAQTIATRRGARTMTVDPTTHRLYTVSAEYDAAPAPTATNPRPRPPMKPDSFTLIVVAP